MKDPRRKGRPLCTRLFWTLFCAALSLILLSACSPTEETKKGEETTMKDFGKIAVGDVIRFGAYDQDGKTDTPKEELTWRVLAVDNQKALVITTEGIDCQLYNVEAISTEWEKCSLRKWLNSTFLSDAFSEAEAAQILTTKVLWEENPSFAHTPGNNTEDKLFLLSISEAEAYFASDEERQCKPTALALQRSAYADAESGTCPWWLRNQGSVPECAALVTEFGAVDHSGDGVYCEGTAVRPAMWIRLP